MRRSFGAGYNYAYVFIIGCAQMMKDMGSPKHLCGECQKVKDMGWFD
jgi:hypothetical protein